METTREQINNLLKTSRQAAGLTQLKAAKALGYKNQTFVTNWENGRSNPPSDAVIKLRTIYKGKLDTDKLRKLYLKLGNEILKEKFNF